MLHKSDFTLVTNYSLVFRYNNEVIFDFEILITQPIKQSQTVHLI